MIGLFQRLLGKQAEVIDPEVALIVQELDDELTRDHELLADNLTGSRDIGDLLRGFAQRCQKVAIVGSYRRGKAEPGDVDVLYIPKNNVQVVEFLEHAADDEQQISRADSRWSCTINGKKVDFIESSTANWGWDMVQFTGSRDFNARVLRHAQRRGHVINNGRPTVRRDDGYHSYNAPAFSGWSEEKILTTLGLEKFMDPRSREAPEAGLEPATGGLTVRCSTN